ncbi:MAG: hypothetical protein HY554_06030 [Elusimicrobia bacterium]|nr:hypothetical protein [Elusimicrobiota bacterium]
MTRAHDADVTAPPSSIVAAFALGAALFGIGALLEPRAPGWVRLGCLPGTILAALAARWLLGRQAWKGWIGRVIDEHNADLQATSSRRVGWLILFATALGLYFELLIIRWHCASLHMFNFFKNVSLLSCFLGLGLGYARGGAGKVQTPLFLPALALQFLIFHVVSATPLQHGLSNPIPEHMIMGALEAQNLSPFFLIYGFFAIVFTLNALTFVPLGHLASWLMERESKLVAYGWNLAGGLLGILVFTGLSMLWTPPAVWLLVGGAGLAWFFRRTSSALFLSLLSLAATLGLLLGRVNTAAINVYSPYQFLSFVPGQQLPASLQASHLFFQLLMDHRPERNTALDFAANQREGYDRPYRYKPRPEHVLIVGSGTGNNVAAALRNGAGQIDAVEIDPAILEFGRRYHPEKPYDDPRVAPIVNDARTHIRNGSKKYDLIVYGMLDAHTTLSSLSGVRLDSFVYTVEAFREARRRLTEDGLLHLDFVLVSPEQGRKIYLMLQEAFDGQPPFMIDSTFLIGPGLSKLPEARKTPKYSLYADPRYAADVSTDDWPFLYMVSRHLPTSYFILLAFLSLLAYLVIRGFDEGERSGRLFSPVFFFLGVGFMLLETKNITQLGLTFGNTWLVVTIAIAGVLVMAFLANAAVLRKKSIPAPAVYAVLLALLALTYCLPADIFASLPAGSAKGAAALLLSAPFFFSGIAFSLAMAESSVPIGTALSSNLMGAIVGGCLEFNAMPFGYNSLYLLAIASYAAALFFSRRPAPAGRGVPAPV